MDIYTGRVLWETKLPGLGKFYDPARPAAPARRQRHRHQLHLDRGRHLRRSQQEHVCASIRVTGRRLQEFRLPTPPARKHRRSWGYLNVHDDYLIGGAYPLVLDPKVEAMPLQLQVWDVAGQKRLFTLEGHADQVTAVAFSPDGRLLATGSGDKTVKLWHAATGRLAASLPGHTSRVTCAAFAPDGKTLATGSDDTSIILWDVADAQVDRHAQRPCRPGQPCRLYARTAKPWSAARWTAC